eukprot:CAMPEP_0201523576 /NCGR_PEP_ID=MMETSP0161_2-20130828/20356_1 /ASSEMBLY_ACC=CAM_ASM_000251 /TAXON_ID=180227 /ORGANISM="Neoparamoeba aestuarina, Strain SoJaBio B1-5/56/2" /LENGTH=246 /DNA_ID=CAMNT_0047922739 /DNA_START=83 /DNA_END=823 /DNA_ORIENTATION=+
MKLLLVLCALFVASQAWDCKFDIDGYSYDLTPGSKGTGSDSSNGLWTTGNTGKPGTFYFQLCDPTTSTPNVGNSNECNQITPTQVCQQDGVNLDWSCGINPSTTAYGDPGKGVVMAASGGSDSGCTSGRSSFVRVICPDGTGFSSGTVKFVEENPTCTYTIALYHDVGCAKGSSGLSGGSIFLIIFFVGFAVYFAAGAGWNYYQGKRGIEIIPQVEFWKDLPFLVKDGVMFLVGKCTGGGSYSTVE